MEPQAAPQPHQLGIYLVQRLLGRGGMGTVYLALDPTLQRPVALKVLAPELAADPEFVARFHREATSLARIRHPNLVHIYAVGHDAGRHFIAMEYLRGLTVADLVRQRGPLAPPEAVRLLGQVLAALDKVHAAGIVHRDLKPANIIVDEDQRAILTDFGLAKSRHDHTVTTGNTLLGTPEYMAPELAEGAEADFRTDVYALGVILFELVTGRVPYRGPSAIATLRQHVERPTPSAAELVPGLPPALNAAIARAMAKRPEARYPHVRAFAADLVGTVATYELAELAGRARGGAATAPPGATAALASPTTPTVAAHLLPGAPTVPLPETAPSAAAVASDAPSTATVASDTSEPPTDATLRVRRPRAWQRLAAVGAGVLLGAALAMLALRLYHRAGGPPAPRASQTVFLVTARGRAPVTGRLLRVEGEAGLVAVKTAEGVVEIPYRDVLKLEPLVGR